MISLITLLNFIGEDKVPEQLKTFCFRAKPIALVKKDGGLRSIVIGNTLRHIVSNCAGSKRVFE